MRRTDTTFSSTIGRLRVPILTLVAGVGFVVQGTLTAVDVEGAAPGVGALSLAGPAAESALHPAAGLSALLSLGDRPAERRAPRSRVTGGSGPEPHAGAHAAGTPSLASLAFRRARTSGSPATLAASVSARDALARAGRLSAPTTAPPTSPF